MDVTELQRRAGIVNESAYDGSQHPQAIADNFINGNIKDAFQAIGGDISLFANVALFLRENNEREFMRFLVQASARGQ